jgi:hypothetical protein
MASTALPPLNEDVASLAAIDHETAWRTIFAYSNSATPFAERSAVLIARVLRGPAKSQEAAAAMGNPGASD